MKFSIKDFLSKCDQIRSFLRICSGLLKNSLMENFIFCGVLLDKMMALANNIDISKAMGKVFETSCVVLLACEVSLHCRLDVFWAYCFLKFREETAYWYRKIHYGGDWQFINNHYWVQLEKVICLKVAQKYS